MSRRIVKRAMVGAAMLSLLLLANLSTPSAEQADPSDQKAVLDKINMILGELEALKASVQRQEKRFPEGEKKGDKSAPRAEVKNYARGYKPLPVELRKALHAAAFKRHGYLLRRLANNVTPPKKFDCADLGWVPPVRNQDPTGVCKPGDCHLVSAVDAITCAFIKVGWGKKDDTFKISDQYGLDCKDFGGCGGGNPYFVIVDCKDNGIPAERYIDPATGNNVSDYGPYTSIPGQCQLKSGAKMWKIQDWGFVAADQGEGAANLDQIKAALMTYGVLSISLDATTLVPDYHGGVIQSLGSNVNHVITMIGWDDSKGALHCRNNWGTDWGEGGYCWISYDALPQIVEAMWVLAPPLATTGAPVFTSAGTAAGVVGTAFNFPVTATNSPTSYEATTPLPAGLSIDKKTGVISGTPTAASTSTVTLTATNAVGPTQQMLTITLTLPGAPVFTSAATAAGVVGTAFNFQVAATNSPTSYEATTPLPPGLAIDKLTGVISGTPTAAGTTPVNLTVTNAVGSTQGTLTITVTSGTPPPQPQPCPAPDYSVEIRARIDWWTKNYPKYADPLKRP